MGENRDLVFRACQPEMDLPFTETEFAERLTRIRNAMDAQGLDVLWLMAPESLYYVSGYKCIWYQAQSPKSWPATSGIAIHRDRDDFILFDTPSEAIMCRYVTCAKDIRVFPMDGRRDGLGFIIEELKAEGWLSGGTVGMEFHSYRPNPAISHRFQRSFEQAGMTVTDGSDILRNVRWIKSPAEIAYLEKAAEITDTGLEAAKAAIRPGATELDIQAEMLHAMGKAGGETPAITLPVNSGLKANCGHAMAGRRRIQPGEQVNLDISGVYNRYHANAGRSFYVGDPPNDVLDYHNLSSGVFDVIDSILRPGLPVAELVSATRAYYEDVGIWSDAGWVGGYELGLAFPPDWVGNYVYEMSDTDTDRVLAPGTIVNFESQFFAPRMSGITYYIDTLLFKEDGASRPLAFRPELVVLDS
ncbi:M24 family metallopeptidase [Roseovarius salis]|uniref:M24 family metallopeptidase n=1 Tax=Roseovarius salis TaxID=3376063 RepID=UPI0037C6EF70